MANETEPTFEIGLAMAGAVSAGAYSAGVMDFLLEALDEWEKVRGQPGIPNHRVVIKVLSGASAGAITGALGVVALAGGLRPKDFNTLGPLKIHSVLPNLYEAWVVKPRLVASGNKGRDLLSLEDLDGKTPVTSVLNSTLLDEIRTGAFALPGPGPKLPYVASSLHVYLTVTNLRGIPYAETFAGGAYGMQCHGDRMHYVVEGLGGAKTASKWADSDAKEVLNVSGLFPQPTPAWTEYGRAAVASGAFPVGLAPRLVKTNTGAYRNRYLPIELPARTNPAGALEPFLTTPAWPSSFYDPATPDQAFEFLSVDGGVINNEPFEYARFTLMKDPPHANPREGKDASRAVVMIDPFPEPPDFLADGKPPADIVGAVSALFPALVNQARFKPSELADAANEKVFSRFLVAPKRGSSLFGIACGLLGGFGGFLDEQFRQHDFQLGRRNCQRFLEQAFALPGNNAPIVETWTDAARNNPQCRTDPDDKGDVHYRIIPIVGSAAKSVAAMSWPRMSADDFETLQDRLGVRLTEVTKAVIKGQTKSTKLQLVFMVAARVGRNRILDYVRYAVLADLIKRDQIAGWDLPPALNSDETRAVVAELANPAFSMRTVQGLARTTKLPAGRVTKILDGLRQAEDRPYSIWTGTRDGKTVYTLESRRPSTLHQLPIIGGIVDYLDEPVID